MESLILLIKQLFYMQCGFPGNWWNYFPTGQKILGTPKLIEVFKSPCLLLEDWRNCLLPFTFASQACMARVLFKKLFLFANMTEGGHK